MLLKQSIFIYFYHFLQCELSLFFHSEYGEALIVLNFLLTDEITLTCPFQEQVIEL